MSLPRRIVAFRRTLLVAAAWAVAMGIAFVPGRASGEPGQTGTVAPGVGSAYAQGYKVDPRSGRLSFGIAYGLTLAGHQNQVARAEARSVDLGLIGTTLAGEGCDGGEPTFPAEDQPQPLAARSDEEAGQAGVSDSENGVAREAKATSQPYAMSRAVTAAAGQAGVFQIGSTESTTMSGLIDGARAAIGSTHVSSITFAGGAVVLRGLHWEARHSSAPTESLTGSFTIDGVEVAGQKLPIPSDDPLAPLAQANTVLNTLGFFLEPPVVRKDAGIVFVDPLRIGIEPNTTRDQLLGQVFSAVQPVRKSVFDALIEADCSNASYITVADVVLGSITGAGSLAVEVGGVTASSRELGASSLLGGGSLRLPGSTGGSQLPPVPGSSNPSSVAVPRLSPTAPTGAVAAPVARPSSAAAGTATPTPTAPISVDDVIPDGERGGALAAVGLAGIGLLAALAEADRRKMRRAQRTLMEIF